MLDPDAGEIEAADVTAAGTETEPASDTETDRAAEAAAALPDFLRETVSPSH